MREAFRSVAGGILAMSILASLVILHLQLMTLQAGASGSGSQKIVLGNPLNPTCQVSVEGVGLDMVALAEAGVWRSLAACEAGDGVPLAPPALPAPAPGVEL